MSPKDSASVLDILQFILDTPQESLRSHKSKVLAAVQKLQASIGDESTASSAASCSNAPVFPIDDLHRSSSSTSQRHPQNSLEPAEAVSLSLAPNDVIRPRPHLGSIFAHNSPQQPHLGGPPTILLPDSIKNILTRLIKTLEKTGEFLSHASHEAVRNDPSWVTDDPRITDIEVAGRSKKSTHTKFRRGLSQRSLAMEFDDWERSTFGTSRISERVANPSVEPSRKLGNIRSFLDANLHRFANLSAARDGIEHGMKLLVCERLLGGIGFSALLIFQFDSLRLVKYPELMDLKSAIDKEESVKNLAKLKADWFGDCQNKYNTWCSNFARSSKKRHCQSNPVQQQKRLKPREPHGTPQGNPMQGSHGSTSSQILRIDRQAGPLQSNVPIIGGVNFDAEAPSLRSEDNRTSDNISSVLPSSDTHECIPLPWTPGRTQSCHPQVQHGEAHSELQSLDTHPPHSQAQANYNLASLASYGSSISMDDDLESNQPLLQPQTNYNLVSLARYGPSLSDNGNLTSHEPLSLQSQFNYNLASLARYGPSLSDDGNLAYTGSSSRLDANYNIAGGYLNQEAPMNLGNNQVPNQVFNQVSTAT